MPETIDPAAAPAIIPPDVHDRIALIVHFEDAEERLLRDIDVMRDSTEPARFDPRWLSIAQTHLQQGFMALARAVLPQPRIPLPGDEKPDT